MADLSQIENMTAGELLKISKDEKQTKDMRAAATRELSRRSMGAEMNRGGDAKKVPAVAISFGMVDAPKNGKNKAKMMRGGMANKREHMYSTGGSVEDRLKPLPKGPKGKGVRNLPDSVQMNMGFDPKS